MWKRWLARRCEVTVSMLRFPEWLSKLPGPGESFRSALGWTPLLHTPSSGVWLFRGALQGEQILAALVSSVDWVVRGTYRTAWAVAPRCRCSYAYGRRVAVGPQTGERSWEFLCDLWRAIAPLFAPWCAEGEMPTCANLNHYGGEGSCVRWHRDDEALFGEQGESKLIVSVSIGYSALFRWKPRSSPECDADSCWLHHGELLVMDGSCQDEYLHCTDPKLDGERVNITYRWLKKHLPQCPAGTGVMCCLPACVRGSPVSVCAGIQGSGWGWRNFLWFLLGLGIVLLAFLAFFGGGMASTQRGVSSGNFFASKLSSLLESCKGKFSNPCRTVGFWRFWGTCWVWGFWVSLGSVGFLEYTR